MKRKKWSHAQIEEELTVLAYRKCKPIEELTKKEIQDCGLYHAVVSLCGNMTKMRDMFGQASDLSYLDILDYEEEEMRRQIKDFVAEEYARYESIKDRLTNEEKKEIKKILRGFKKDNFSNLNWAHELFDNYNILWDVKHKQKHLDRIEEDYKQKELANKKTKTIKRNIRKIDIWSKENIWPPDITREFQYLYKLIKENDKVISTAKDIVDNMEWSPEDKKRWIIWLISLRGKRYGSGKSKRKLAT